jgi:hypothetical protein
MAAGNRGSTPLASSLRPADAGAAAGTPAQAHTAQYRFCSFRAKAVRHSSASVRTAADVLVVAPTVHEFSLRPADAGATAGMTA